MTEVRLPGARRYGFHYLQPLANGTETRYSYSMKKQLTQTAYDLRLATEAKAARDAKTKTVLQRVGILTGTALVGLVSLAFVVPQAPTGPTQDTVVSGIDWRTKVGQATPAEQASTQTVVAAAVAPVPTTVEPDISHYQRDPVHGYPVNAWKHLKGEERQAALKEHCESHLVYRDFAPECAE